MSCWYTLGLWAACRTVEPAPLPTTIPPTGTTTGDTSAADCEGVEILGFQELGQDWDAPEPTVTLVHGPQGGWHVGGAARVRGARVHDVTTTVVDTVSGLQLAGAENTHRMTLFSYDERSCEGELLGIITYLDDVEVDQEGICALVGHILEVELVVTDPDTGMSDRVMHQVRAVADPADPCAEG